MAPVRVGLIGLGPSISKDYQPGEWGVQHMKAINSSPNYELVAVANSSVESAQRSIKAHNLPETVKAYGSPEDIAEDPNVDLVVIAVSVDKHARLVKPAFQNNKDVLIEFPVAPAPSETEELAQLAKASGSKFLAGTQGRSAPEIRKLKELVNTKAIGDIVFSSFTGHLPIVVSYGWPKALTSYLDLKPGATRVTVNLGHTIDAFVNVVGGFKSLQSVLKVQGKTAALLDTQGNIVDPAYKVTAPDTILVQGILKSGAAANFSVRSSTTTADEVGFRWVISGTEGEIIFTSGPGFIQMGTANTRIQLRKWGAEKAEDIDFSSEEKLGDLSDMALSVARLYEAIAASEEDAYATVEQALQTEKLLEEIVKAAIWAP
ncbi:Galactose/lactose metabolism regulatory protein GAL80 [Paramyrothecium foliicola]|nr:Galactose/lactose metabolism regulatory protein GAL80 [Paramyrothecium foliicola]